MTIAWAVMQPDSYSVFVSYDKAVAHRDICAGGDIIPLYRSPNPTDKEIERLKLTDKEIEAIKWCAEQWTGIKRAETLRNLLERIKDK